MELFRFEIRKLFLNKRTILIMLACILISLGTGLMAINNVNNNSGGLSKLDAMIQEHEGTFDPLLVSKAKDEVNRLQALRVTDPSAFEKEDPAYVAFQYLYANADGMLQNYRYGSERENPERPYSIARMQAYLDRHSNEKDGFDYINVQLNLQMKLASGEPKFYNVLTWDEMFGFLNGGGTLFLIFFLAIVITPVFSGETASGMDSIILSSKLGRRKIVTAKLLSAAVFALIWVVLFLGLNFILYAFPSGAWTGLNKPLNSIYIFHISPYGGWPIFLYFLVSAGFALSACLTLAMTAAFISATQRSSLLSFGIILGILFLPVVMDAGALRTLFWPVVDFGFIRIAQSVPLFSGYKAYNIFGSPFLHPYAVVIVLFILCAFMIWLTYFVYKRKNATI